MVRNSVDNSSFDCKSDALPHHQPAKNNPLKSNVIQSALKAIEGLNLKVELCGNWLWIFKADASHQAQLQAANFKWSYQKGAWYFCPNKNTPRLSGSKRPPTPMEKVREKYGSQVVQL
jgi:hypothetical protein